MKLSIKDFFSKCDQIRSFLRIWSHLLKTSLTENFIFLCSDICLGMENQQMLLKTVEGNGQWKFLDNQTLFKKHS